LNTFEEGKKIKLPEHCHIEGGDVMPHGDYILVGTYRGEDYSSFITARTNVKAVDELQKLFPHKTVNLLILGSLIQILNQMLCIWIVVFSL